MKLRDDLVLFFSEKDIRKIRRIFSAEDQTLWLYLGKDYSKRNLIERKLGNRFKCFDISRMLDIVAKEIKFKHIEWIDDLNRLYGQKIEWWFGTISSRNNYESNLFQYACYLEILQRLWHSDVNNKPKLIFIESLGLANTIQKWAYQNNITITILNIRAAKFRHIIFFLRFFSQWYKYGITLLLRIISSHLSSKNSKQKDIIKTDTQVIVNTFIHNSSLSNSGDFKDRYFPYLHEYLNKKGIKVLIHPLIYKFKNNFFSIYKRMRRSNFNFIIPEDFLKFSDYFYAVTYPLMVIRRKINPSFFNNFDFSEILNEERIRSVAFGIQAVLIYRLFLRLGRAGLKVRFIIDWYENQVIDKALIAGARRAFPDIKIIGAQMFIHLPNFLSLYPSQSEVEAGIIPDIIIETSEHQCQIAKTFTKDIFCKPAASLRYSHIFNDTDILNPLTNKEKTILILLPFDLSGAVELLDILKGALDKIDPGLKILIKCHPDYSSQDLVRAFGKKNWSDRFNIHQGSLEYALKQASIVIASNSSSILEAAIKGIPVIFIGRQTVLSQNPLSEVNTDIVTECFSKKELDLALQKYLSLMPKELDELKDKGIKLRDIFFTPVNETTLLPFTGNLL